MNYHYEKPVWAQTSLRVRGGKLPCKCRKDQRCIEIILIQWSIFIGEILGKTLAFVKHFEHIEFLSV
jgi:hypothetical protein